MNKRITLPELEKYLWDSAVLLRSNVDAGAYKQYIFPLLFFKRISDVYDEECEHIKEMYPDTPEALEWPEEHSFILPEGARWADVRSVSRDIGEALTKAFKAIEAANIEKLQGIFGDASWSNKQRLTDRLLKDLIEHFSTQTLSLANCPEDELGQGYEYLIKQFADDSGHTAQEFYTNRTVVHLMTELLKPQSGESIYDPTCGTAGMLISSIAYLKEQGREWRNVKLYGQEIVTLTSAIARMNLLLHGVKDFDVVNADTLETPAFIENGQLKTFNMVLANPPYSIKNWNREAFSNDKYGRNFLGVPNQNRADFAFIQHILKSLDSKNGRCAILLPNGVLNRHEEANMRKELAKNDLVECVIGLGKNLFYNSPMEACILICNTNKCVNRKNKVMFIDGRRFVFKKNTESVITPEQLDSLSDIYFRYEDMDKTCGIATSDDIAQKNYSFAVNLYINHADDKSIEDIQELSRKWLETTYNSNGEIALFSNVIKEREHG